MAESIKAGGGSLGPNRDRTEERHPNYKGKLVTEIDLPAGSTIWLSGWLRDGDNGKWISIAAQVSGQAQSQGAMRRPSGISRPPQRLASPPRQQSNGGYGGGGYAGDPMDDEAPF